MNTNEIITIKFIKREVNQKLELELSSRFLSVDAYVRQFGMLTPYQCASNTPISAIDLDGNEALDYRVLRIDKEGNAYVNVKISSGSTSRDNGGILMLTNLATGVSGTSTGSKNLDLALGTAYTSSIKHKNVREQVSSGSFNPQAGATEYTISLQSLDMEAANVKYFSTDELVAGVSNSTHDEADGYQVMTLIVPPEPAPNGNSGNRNLDAPGTYGGTTENFMEKVEMSVKEAFVDVNQTADEIKKVVVSIPDTPEYSKMQSKIKAALETKFKNAEVTVLIDTVHIEGKVDYNLSTDMTGSPKQKLKVD